MKRKTLITSALIIIMLLNLLVPITQVKAADEEIVTNDVITLNTKLYDAIKANLQSQGFEAIYNDAARTIKINQEEVEKVEKFILSNFAIDNLTGLDFFTNLNSIDLSSNKLTQDSHLEVLSNLPLTFLDLSSNEIEDVSMITNIDSITKVNLHNQRFNIVELIPVDNSEESDEIETLTYDIPQILQKAGFMESEWVIDNRVSDTGVQGQGPNISWRTFGKTVTVKVGTKTDSGYIPNYGMIRLKIQIKDPTNIMYNSDINLFFVTYKSQDQMGIVFKDEALYRAVKSQLTQGQTLNSKLTKYTDVENLYDAAYDNGMFDPLPMVLVINLNDLINKISSLDLRSKGIKDVTGLEWFVGLKEIDLFDNRIENVDKIVELRENKIAEAGKLKQRVAKRVEAIKTVYTKMKTLETQIKTLDKQIEKLQEEIDDLYAKRLTVIAEGKPTNDIDNQITAKDKEINEKNVEIAKAEQEFAYQKGLLEMRLESLYNTTAKEYLLTTILTPEINTLTDKEFFNLTHAKAKSLFEAQASRFAAIESTLTSYEKSYLIAKYGIPTEVAVQKQVTDPVTGTKTTTTVMEPIENPIGKFFTELSSNLADIPATLGNYKNYIKEFKTIETIFKMANYSLIDRLYFGTTYTDAEYIDYLDRLIEEKQEDYQDVSYVENIKTDITTILADLESYGFNAYNAVDYNTDFNEIYSIAGKFARVTTAEIDAYLTIIPLRVLDIGANLIESIDTLAVLTELRVLKARKNQIFNINNVNWSAFAELQELDLSFNDLVDVKCLEGITTLRRLNLAKNLIEGKYDFDFGAMSDLEYIDFSENRITDVSFLKILLEWVARDEGFYSISDFMNAGILDIRFYNQVLTMNFALAQSSQLVYVDAPIIFSQLKDMDFARTYFGTNSVNGNLTNDGKYIIIDATRLGTKVGEVFVDAGTGGPGIGYGTTCTLYYTVKTVEEIEYENDNMNTNTNTNANTNTNTEENTNTNTDENTNTNTNTNPVSSDYTVKNNEFVVGVSPRTSVEIFKTNLLNNTTADSIEVKADNPVQDNDYVATAMLAVLYDAEGEMIEIYEIVVKGDIDGDGFANSIDSKLMKEYRAGITTITGAYLEAADINQDGKVNTIDSKLLLYHRAEIEGYVL